ncbi:glycosyltransferase family 8 protein [Rhizobium sp. PAMB 3182]
MSDASRPILVATAVDRSGVVAVMALVRSLAENSPQTALVILSVDLSVTEEALLRAVADQACLSVSIMPFDTGLLRDVTLRSPHVSRAAYARLFLPECLPKQDRVIWLDADTVVLDDLAPLWRVDLGSNLVAAAPDLFIAEEDIVATGSRKGCYFNSGVMLINLTLWRAEAIVRRARSHIAAPDLICEDQSVLNRLCQGRVRLLGHEWNFHGARFDEYPVRIRRIHPKILHFCGQRKPWLGPMPFGRVFLRHLPGDIRKATVASFSPMPVLRRVELMQRRICGLLAGQAKHWTAGLLWVELVFAELRLARRRSAPPIARVEFAPDDDAH